MAHSSAYILSSRSEGLATVLTEALTLGMPIISTDVSGAKEVLGEKNEYGLVVDNSKDGIYQGMKEFLTNQSIIKEFREKAFERAKFFNAENTVLKVERFFEGLLEG